MNQQTPKDTTSNASDDNGDSMASFDAGRPAKAVPPPIRHHRRLPSSDSEDLEGDVIIQQPKQEHRESGKRRERVEDTQYEPPRQKRETAVVNGLDGHPERKFPDPRTRPQQQQAFETDPNTTSYLQSAHLFALKIITNAKGQTFRHAHGKCKRAGCTTVAYSSNIADLKCAGNKNIVFCDGHRLYAGSD